MPDDLTNQAAPGGVPFNYQPMNVQQLYSMLQARKKQQQPLTSYYHPLAAVGDIAETFADQMQFNRLLGASQAGLSNRPDFADPFGGGGDSSGQASTGAQPAPSGSQAVPSGNVDTGGVPASIRNNNPGAQWPGPSSAKFGATGSQDIAGGNKIASFADPVQGAAAQFDLLGGSNYTGKTLRELIGKWSGGHDANDYTNHVAGVTGLTPDTVITPDMIRDPKVGVPLAQAMAYHEAGRPYPLTPDQWTQAHGMAFGGGQQVAQAGPSQQGFRPPTASMSSLPSMEQINRLNRSPLPEDRAEARRLLQLRQEAAKPQSYTDEEGIRHEGNPYTGYTAVPGPTKSQVSETTELGKSNVKTFEAVHSGLTGMANTSSFQKANISLVRQAAANPNFMSGVGEEYNLFTKRLAAQFGFAAPDKAAPQEVVRQALKKIVSDQYAGMRQLTEAGGENAATRIFQAMVNTEAMTVPSEKDSMEGLLQKLNVIDKTGDLFMTLGDKADDYKKEHGRLDTDFLKQTRKEVADWGKKFELQAETPILRAPSMFGGGAMPTIGGGATPPGASPAPGPSPSIAPATPTGPAPMGSSIGDIISRGPPGPGITAQARAGFGLPAAVPSAGPLSRYTSDVTAQARRHPEGLPYALGAGGLGAGASAASSALANSPRALKAIIEALGIGGGIAGTEEIVRHLMGR